MWNLYTRHSFEIKRSLSTKGCPYDNSPAESFNNILKTECIKGKKFNSLRELEIELMDYINWYNNHRIANKFIGIYINCSVKICPKKC